MLFDLFKSFSFWTYNSALGLGIRESKWGFAGLEVVHLFGLTILLGSIVMLSLRYLGLTMRKHPIRVVARELAPATATGLVIVVTSGVLMFVSGAVRYYISGAFQFKMLCFIVANIVHFSLYRRVTRSNETNEGSRWIRIMGVVGLFLWISVGAAGRAIAFL
jgi:uncharacterized membrane protein